MANSKGSNKPIRLIADILEGHDHRYVAQAIGLNKPIRLIADTLEAHNHRYVAQAIDDAGVIRIEYNGKIVPKMYYYFICPTDSAGCMIRSSTIVRVPEDRTAEALRAIARLNGDYLYALFQMNENNEVFMVNLLPRTLNDACLGNVAYAQMRSMFSVLNSAYPILTKIGEPVTA